MGLISAITGGLKIASGLAGLFGKKKKATTPRDNLLSQAQGAREAAEKYGFNPLTMLQYGQTGAMSGGGGGAPPLASIDLIVNGLSAFDPEKRADEERQRAADQLNLDLAKLRLEQARSGVIIGPQVAANGVGPGLSPLGSKAAQVYQGAGYGSVRSSRGSRSRGVGAGDDGARVSDDGGGAVRSSGGAGAGASGSPVSSEEYPRRVRAFGIDWFGDDDFDAGDQVEEVLGDSLITEPIMGLSAFDMVYDTVNKHGGPRGFARHVFGAHTAKPPPGSPFITVGDPHDPLFTFGYPKPVPAPAGRRGRYDHRYGYPIPLRK